jgi:hypothetical protein
MSLRKIEITRQVIEMEIEAVIQDQIIIVVVSIVIETIEVIEAIINKREIAADSTKIKVMAAAETATIIDQITIEEIIMTNDLLLCSAAENKC